MDGAAVRNGAACTRCGWVRAAGIIMLATPRPARTEFLRLYPLGKWVLPLPLAMHSVRLHGVCLTLDPFTVTLGLRTPVGRIVHLTGMTRVDYLRVWVYSVRRRLVMSESSALLRLNGSNVQCL